MTKPFQATFVGRMSEAAAQVAATGNGLPKPEFVDLATYVLANLVCYRNICGLREQDTDYLARMLQAVAWHASQ